MKLYKILNVLGDHGVSVFPSEELELPPVEYSAGEPMTDLIRQIIMRGYTEHEAYLMVQAWAYHAKTDLHQLARGVRVFCEMCVERIPVRMPPAEPLTWMFIVTAAVAAAIALGLYLWVTLDQEINVRFGDHEWAYLMSYKERLWQGEIFVVGLKQRGIYEQGGDLGAVIVDHERNVGYVGRRDWIWLKPGAVVLEGRKVVFYHVYRLKGFWVYFCGLASEFASGLYRLREGGRDPYKPTGPWSRPGARWGRPEYEGCWREWWWF